MKNLRYCCEGETYLDANTLRELTCLPKMTLQRRLDVHACKYVPVVYQCRKLYPIAILEAFPESAITMESQKDNAPTTTLKNESND